MRPCFKRWGQGGGEEGSGERRDGLLLPHFKEHIFKKKKKQGLTLYLIWSGVPYADWAGLKLKEIQPMPPKSC